MRLVKLSEFRRLVFAPGSAPAEKTLRAKINQIPGGTVVLGHYYVDMDVYDAEMKLRRQISNQLAQLEKDPRLADLL